MGEDQSRLRNFVTDLHESTARNYFARMADEKIQCMRVARRYEQEYWDGDRRFGYGGYRYIPGRWQPVAESLIQTYHLDDSSRVLDVGCGKGFLLTELRKLLPGCRLEGIDISQHAIQEMREMGDANVITHDAATPYPFSDDEFDLVISLGCLHNFTLPALEVALSEIQRVGSAGYVMMESYRNEKELFNLQCWALTAESFLDPDEWRWVFDRCGYQGDYEFIFFE